MVKFSQEEKYIFIIIEKYSYFNVIIEFITSNFWRTQIQSYKFMEQPLI